ncbi:hypothetical protein DFH09DRAFT_1295593 [Mycena vulgaris]|nr:hypothetical protein DFH09DRAFT_1295593 [Mycena vulgaris]
MLSGGPETSDSVAKERSMTREILNVSTPRARSPHSSDSTDFPRTSEVTSAEDNRSLCNACATPWQVSIICREPTATALARSVRELEGGEVLSSLGSMLTAALAPHAARRGRMARRTVTQRTRSLPPSPSHHEHYPQRDSCPRYRDDAPTPGALSLPPTLARPPFTDIGHHALLAAALELSGLPAELIRHRLCAKPPQMLAGIAALAPSHLPTSLPRSYLPAALSVPLCASPGAAPVSYHTHVLAIAPPQKAKEGSAWRCTRSSRCKRWCWPRTVRSSHAWRPPRPRALRARRARRSPSSRSPSPRRIYCQ